MNMDKILGFGQHILLSMPETIITLGVGLAILLFGYRIKKIAFFIIWFLIGYNLMDYLMPLINGAVPQIEHSELFQVLLPIAGGLLMALLGFSIEKLCVGGICFALVMIVTARYFGTEISALAVGGIIGIILAGLAVTMMKPAIIIATSVAGAYALTLALLSLITSIDQSVYYWPMLIGLGVLGSVFQFATTKRIE